jgi:hypothetical protein
MVSVAIDKQYLLNSNNSIDLKILKILNFKFTVKLCTSSPRYKMQVDIGCCIACFPVHFRPSGNFLQ